MAEFQLIDETITLIAALEGCKLIAYPDVTGFAIGYGSHKHLDGSTVKKGDTITQEEAIKLLKQRVENEFFPHAKRILINSKINSYQAGAVTSLIYNCGTGNIASKSSVIKAINTNPEDPKIKDLFAEWRLSGGKVCEGLCIRRAREYEFYKNKKINMNVPYVYNSDLGGYAVNDESDAVVGNSKNETKYINTNYCASIKCYDEPEPVVGDGDYENYSESYNAIVNNPLVYKGNEAISIANCLKDGGYKINNFKKEKDLKSCLWFRSYIIKDSDICGVIQIYIFSDSKIDTYISVNKIDIKLVANKINEIVDDVNKVSVKKFDKLNINKGNYTDNLQKLKQYIINNSDLPNIDRAQVSPQEKFNFFCIENCKKNSNLKDYGKNILKVHILKWSKMETFGIISETDNGIWSTNEDSIFNNGIIKWDDLCIAIIKELTNKYGGKKKLPLYYYMEIYKLGKICKFFSLSENSKICILKYSDNKCVVFNWETGEMCKKHNKTLNDILK